MKKDTRDLLLDSAFKEFYKSGFQGSNISSILNEVGINKGSMYHFFKSKKELGLSVIQERIKTKIVYKYTQILNFDMLFNTLIDAPNTLIYGCPLNKMSQEMIYIDEDFKKALSLVYKEFENYIKNILTTAMQNKEIPLCDKTSTAQLIIATYEGALMIYHLNQDKEQYKQILHTLKINLLVPKDN